MRNIPCRNCAQGHAVLLITVVPLGAGRFEAWCDGRLIVACTREPLLAGARALLAAGHDPTTVAVMRHAGSDTDSLTARIGTAAGFYVEESAHGPILRSVRNASPSAVDRPPIAQTRPALVPPAELLRTPRYQGRRPFWECQPTRSERRNDHGRADDHGNGRAR
jgi:hypothetical protein